MGEDVLHYSHMLMFGAYRHRCNFLNDLLAVAPLQMVINLLWTLIFKISSPFGWVDTLFLINQYSTVNLTGIPLGHFTVYFKRWCSWPWACKISCLLDVICDSKLYFTFFPNILDENPSRNNLSRNCSTSYSKTFFIESDEWYPALLNFRFIE